VTETTKNNLVKLPEILQIYKETGYLFCDMKFIRLYRIFGKEECKRIADREWEKEQESPEQNPLTYKPK